jgi:CDP-paratose 2-epimerase
VRILISGICGFVGSILAESLLEHREGLYIFGFDNFIRPGSELNRSRLRAKGIRVIHADIRSATDIDGLPAADWVIDAAANPSVLAGLESSGSSRQVVEHNLFGTINLLEYCKRHRSTFTLLSTSRVYSIHSLASLPIVTDGNAFRLDTTGIVPHGVSAEGVAESFSTAPPVSLYGSTKLASEVLALEYAEAFGLRVWINRCGVLAGAGQFGRPDQGIFSFWINAWLRNRPLKYIGFGGDGRQVRDVLHPRDLVPVLLKQIEAKGGAQPRIVNLSGGVGNSMSLSQLSEWCRERFGDHAVASEGTGRNYDVPWLILDCSVAKSVWGWRVQTRFTIFSMRLPLMLRLTTIGWISLASE